MKFEPRDIIESDPNGLLSKFYYKLEVVAVYLLDKENGRYSIDGTVVKCYDLAAHPIGSTVHDADASYFRLVHRPDLEKPFLDSLDKLERKLS